MKRIFNAGVLVLAGLFSIQIAADCNPERCDDVYVERLFPNSAGHVYIATSGDEALLNCDAYSGTQIILRSSHPNKEIIYSTLLAAQFADKIVKIRIVESTSPCEVSYITIDRQ